MIDPAQIHLALNHSNHLHFGDRIIVKEKPGVTRDLIHDHEEMGEKALIVFLITAVVAVS